MFLYFRYSALFPVNIVNFKQYIYIYKEGERIEDLEKIRDRMSKNDEETKRDIKVEKAKELYTSGHRTGSLKFE